MLRSSCIYDEWRPQCNMWICNFSVLSKAWRHSLADLCVRMFFHNVFAFLFGSCWLCLYWIMSYLSDFHW